MTTRRILLALVLKVCVIRIASLDYCAVSCSVGRHVACGNNQKFGTSCPQNIREINMSNMKSKIVEAHNRQRNLIAGGGLSGFRPAARMATMRWSNELAHMASFNVKRCKFEHDRCYGTAEFTHPGQNLALDRWSGFQQPDDQVILRQINRWFAENVDASASNIEKYVAPAHGRAIGHFTAMVNEKNTHVGCAAVKYTKNNVEHLLTACNYARNNFRNQAIYESGTRAATKCNTGVNPSFKNLCSSKEVYNWK